MPFYPHVDIGCGVVALRTQFVGSDLPPDRKPLREANDRTVPLSAGNANAPDSWQDSPHASARIADLEAGAAAAAFDPDSNAESWRRQLGSLGSLNHFIEVSLDEEERVWLLLHSGSRGVGNKIAVHHIKVAQQQCAQRCIKLPDPDLACLVETSSPRTSASFDGRRSSHCSTAKR